MTISTKRIALIVLSLIVCVSCCVLYACNTTADGGKIEVTDKVIGLPGQSVEITISNPQEQVLVSASDYDVCSVTVSGKNTIVVNMLAEGSCTISLSTQSGATATISVRCVDLRFAFDDVQMETDARLPVTFNHDDVDVELSLQGSGATLEGNEIVANGEGSFTLTATCGNIVLTRTISVYDKNSVIDSFARQSNFVRYYGRNVHNDGSVIINNTAAGFEVSFVGTKLSATLDGWFGSWYGYTRLSILVDDETDTTKRVLAVNKGTTKNNYTLVDGLEEGLHTVKVYKRTEALSTSLTLHALQTDGYFCPVEKTRKLRIEAYGDSITAGYGNLRGSLADTTSSEYQSGLQTYATYTAQLLDAEINVQARSGIGMYTSGNIDDALQVNTGYAYTTYDQKYAWNFDNYHADMVIINLGTNDHWNTGVFKADTFVAEYVAFVQKLAAIYGENTVFVLVSGLMEQTVSQYVTRVQQQLMTSIPNVVVTYKFSQCRNGHPLYEEHLEAAKQLSDYLINNGLAEIPQDEPEQQQVSEATGKTVQATINVRTADQLPEHVELWLTGVGDSVKLQRVGKLDWSVEISVTEGDYNAKLVINNDVNYADNAVSVVKVRADKDEYQIGSGTFLTIPEDENPNAETNGWGMSAALFPCGFTTSSKQDVVYTNASNWMAAFLVRRSVASDSYSITTTVKTTAFADKVQTFIGVVPYYIDDQNFVVCYLQYNADGSLKNIGCTGASNGMDIGWHDFWKFANMQIDVTSGVELSVKRVGTTLSVTMNGTTDTNTISSMTGECSQVGVWSLCANPVEYTGFVQTAE